MPVKRRSKAKVSLKQIRRQIRRGNPSHWEKSSSSGESSISNFSMDSAGGSSTQSGAVNNEAKKRKLHEAQLIPGLSPGKQWGFPNSIITKLRYASLIQLNSTTITPLARHLFRCNSCFDPDFTGVGHQPLYYDSYTAIYDQYVVIGAKITVDYMCTSTGQSALIGIAVDDDSTATTNIDTILEANNSISTTLGPLGTDHMTLVSTFEPQEMFGVDAKSDGSSQTAVGSNPSEESYWVLFSYPEDGSTAHNVRAKINIEYTVKFSELKTPIQS
jgi:hypothetical protein